MAENNSTNRTSCLQSDLFWLIEDYVTFAENAILLPIYCTVGLVGRVLCVVAFFYRAKTDRAYFYQIYLEIAQIIDVVLLAALLLSFQASGMFQTSGREWFMKIYGFMWFTAHLAIPLVNGSAILCVFLSLSMSADRAFALAKPFVYKTIDRKLHQKSALIICILLSFASVTYNVRLFRVEISDGDSTGKYRISVDTDFVGTLASVVLSQVCNAVRVIGLVALVGCNICILKTFRKIVKQKVKITICSSSTGTRNEKEAEKKSKENLLVLFTVSQSLFMSIDMISYVAFYTAAYVVPYFNECHHLLYAPLLNCTLMLCGTASTFAVLTLNRRTLVQRWKNLSICKC